MTAGPATRATLVVALAAALVAACAGDDDEAVVAPRCPTPSQVQALAQAGAVDQSTGVPGRGRRHGACAYGTADGLRVELRWRTDADAFLDWRDEVTSHSVMGPVAELDGDEAYLTFLRAYDDALGTRSILAIGGVQRGGVACEARLTSDASGLERRRALELLRDLAELTCGAG